MYRDRKIEIIIRGECLLTRRPNLPRWVRKQRRGRGITAYVSIYISLSWDDVLVAGN